MTQDASQLTGEKGTTMGNATPLTLYARIQQTEEAQGLVDLVYKGFSQAAKGLIDSGIVHYARVALVPNPDGKGTQAFMVITTFDGDMNPYLEWFWKHGLSDTFELLAR